jgi:hypothetical protein
LEFYEPIHELLLPFCVPAQYRGDSCTEAPQIGEQRPAAVLRMPKPTQLGPQSSAEPAHLFVFGLQLVHQGRASREALAKEREQPVFFLVEVRQQPSLEQPRCASEQVQGPGQSPIFGPGDRAFDRVENPKLFGHQFMVFTYFR